jgi:hypothetical protein
MEETMSAKPSYQEALRRLMNAKVGWADYSAELRAAIEVISETRPSEPPPKREEACS